MRIVRWSALLSLWLSSAALAAESGLILTPPAPAAPRINGPSIFGVREDSPFLYTIPATGQRPMQFAADGLPDGVKLDTTTGQITGVAADRGQYKVVLRATNDQGTTKKTLAIVVGDRIALTPPMGWSSWNCWGHNVDQDKVLRTAKAIVSSGLIDHGWTYVNIDDTWQGVRGGPWNAIQPNKKFSDMKELCIQIHAMGLKAGIYSTPWITSYAQYVGGSSDDPSGAWSREMANNNYHHFGKYSFAEADAKQWADWGFDYLKYDWHVIDVAHVSAMRKALRQCGRDVVYSLSNSAPFEHATDWAKLANCWRTTGDIEDHWDKNTADYAYSLSEIAFSQDRWAAVCRTGPLE